MIDALGLGDLVPEASQHQVHALGADGDFGDPAAVVEGIDGVAQFAGGDAVVGEFDPVREHPHLRRPQFKTWLGADLGAFGPGQHPLDPLHGQDRDVEDVVELLSGDVHFDGPRAADAAPE